MPSSEEGRRDDPGHRRPGRAAPGSRSVQAVKLRALRGTVRRSRRSGVPPAPRGSSAPRRAGPAPLHIGGDGRRHGQREPGQPHADRCEVGVGDAEVAEQHRPAMRLQQLFPHRHEARHVGAHTRGGRARSRGPSLESWPPGSSGNGCATRRSHHASPAQTLRARARARTSAGHSAFSGNCSARYSAMASVSQTVTSPSTSTGTRPTGVMPLQRLLEGRTGRHVVEGHHHLVERDAGLGQQHPGPHGPG